MKKWQQQEKNLASDFSGKRVKGSGNKWYSPGDIKSPDFLIEAKQTDKPSYSLNRKKLIKLFEEALFSYRTPLMAINIQGDDFILMWKQDFDKLLSKKKSQ